MAKAGDPRLGTILVDGLDKKLNLIGFPFDEGASRCGLKAGQELGPDCMRRFLPKSGPVINPETKIDVREIGISDYGNIEDPAEENKTLEGSLEKLALKTARSIEKGHFPFVVGGSNDLQYGALKGFLKALPAESKPAILMLDTYVALEGSNDKIDARNFLRYIIEDSNFVNHQNNLSFSIAGLSENQCSQEIFDEATSHKINLIALESGLTSGQETKLSKITEILSNLSQAGHTDVFITTNLGVTASAFAPGCSEYNPFGFSSSEIVHLMEAIGKCPIVRGCTVSNFDPQLEDYRTGRLVANMVYYAMMGIAQRD